MVLHEALIGEATRGLAMELLTLSVESGSAMRVFATQSKARATRLARAAAARGYPLFSRWWVAARLGVSLQTRLWVESVLFSMNKPWSDLVSGFRPLRVPLGRWKP